MKVPPLGLSKFTQDSWVPQDHIFLLTHPATFGDTLSSPKPFSLGVSSYREKYPSSKTTVQGEVRAAF